MLISPLNSIGPACFSFYSWVLSDRAAGTMISAVGIILSSYCPSVRLSVTLCTVAKRYILQQQCLNT